MTVAPTSTRANRINSDSLDWSYIGISVTVEYRDRRTIHLFPYGATEGNIAPVPVFAVFEVRADLQRPMAGRQAIVLDDVVDTGLSLSEAARLVRDAGAREVITCVFARKPWPTPRAIEPDFTAWEAPPRFLVGYGMDAEGRLRGLPYIAAA